MEMNKVQQLYLSVFKRDCQALPEQELFYTPGKPSGYDQNQLHKSSGVQNLTQFLPFLPHQINDVTEF